MSDWSESIRGKWTVKLSRVHEKYLSLKQKPLNHTYQTFQEQSVPKIYYSQVHIDKKEESNPNIMHDFMKKSHLVIPNQHQLQQKIKDFLNGVDTQGKVLGQLGMKPLKKLGKNKTTQQLTRVLQYLQKGTIPEEYIRDWQLGRLKN